MKLAIMQPYFLPYIGYFQLISSVDVMILYDNIKYTKKGWINRNRILQNGKDVMLTLPLKNDSDFCDVRDRELAESFNRDKMVNKIISVYRHAPYFVQVFPLIDQIIRSNESNLFKFIYNSLISICEYFDITTPIKISSNMIVDHDLKSQDKVLALCGAVGADTYVNAIGGIDLYSRNDFQKRGVELKFIKSKPFEYVQFGDEFIPWLSIIDVMMFNSLDAIQECIESNYELI